MEFSGNVREKTREAAEAAGSSERRRHPGRRLRSEPAWVVFYFFGLEAVDVAGGVAEDDDAGRDGGAGGHGAAGGEFPELFAGLEVEDVELLVLAGHVDAAGRDDGRRVDFAARS